jgi:osmoprotectant transport system permease protein
VNRRVAGFIGPALGAAAMIVLFTPTLLDAVLRILFPGAGEWVFDREYLLFLTAEHLALSLVAGGAATFLGMALGIAATRPRGRVFLPLIRDASSLAQTVPPAAVLALAIPFLGFGFKPVLLALVLYSILPVLNNTLTGLETLPEPVLEAARGIGMNRLQVLLKVELPLAMPVIGTGVRTSVVINVGTATIGAVAGAGGLGSPIVAGLIRDNPAWVFQGAMASALLALMLNTGLHSLEYMLKPKAFRQEVSRRPDR